MPGDRSLRRLLLSWLVGPLAVVLLASAIAAYRTAVVVASGAYDRELLDPALAIAQRLSADGDAVRLDLPVAALEALRVDTADRLYFAVSDRGRLIAGQHGLPAPPVTPEDATPVFYDARLGSDTVRVAAVLAPLDGRQVLVQVAETRVKRDRLVRQVLISNALPELAFLLAALGVVWFGVARGLAPLEKLRMEIAARSHRDLRPVSEAQAPEEVRPLVQELNALLARLAGSIDAQQRFVADAAHQLRTPLAALQAQVEAARRGPLPAELGPTFDQLLAATRRTAHLARQLLTLAAVDPVAARPFAPAEVDLATVVHDGVAEWVARADGKRIDLGFELEPAPVPGEALLLRALAANLIDNALAYTPVGGRVTARTGTRGGAPFLEVEDDGPGIPAAERERVFERFYRGKGTAGEGSGLGLAIVREIAHRHGASVAIAAVSGDRGTCLTVRFPGAAAA